MLYATCSTCGRSYGARRVHSGHNFCSPTCKQKAYRARKAQLKKSYRYTYSLDDRAAIQRLAKKYGSDIEILMERIFTAHGGEALKHAIAMVQFIDWHHPE